MPIDPSELERWRGRTDAHLQENSRRLDRINGSVEKIEQGISDLKVELARVTTKVGLIAGIAAALGGGIVAVVIRLSTGG